MQLKWRQWTVAAAIVLGSASVTRLMSDLPFFQLFNLKALDTHFAVRGREPVSNIILLVADKKALDAYAEPLIFWHDYYVEAIRAAANAGARVVGLDAAFEIPIDKWEPDYDRLMAEAVSASPVPVIIGYVPDLNGKQSERPNPINIVAAGLGLSGYSNLTDDPDSFIRRQELLEAPSKKPDDPPPARSMAMRLAEKYVGTDAAFVKGRLIFDGHRIPISGDRSITINYAGPAGTFPRVSLVDFINAARAGDQQKLREWVSGKAVLIGQDTVSDRYLTPFYNPFSGALSNTAGVEIHANVLHTLLDRRYILYVAEWVRLLALLLTAIVATGIAMRFDAGPATAWLALELVGILVGTHLLFRAGRVLYTSELAVTLLICLVAAILYRFSTAQKRGALFRKAISLFVGKEMASALERTESIALTGKRMNVTILFTDIRGFTAFSEQICEEEGAEALVKLLNEYMAQMVAIIVRYHGHVNKFIGDGILAVFSDDDENSTPGDHAIRAVRCATEMVTAPNRFSTGSGIHTGIVIVGNVGSADKMEYTVLGDTVNLASRLESLNKEHHSKLLMSGATQAALGDAVETVHPATVPVRGKSVPINLFTVASLVPSEVAAHVH